MSQVVSFEEGRRIKGRLVAFEIDSSTTSQQDHLGGDMSTIHANTDGIIHILGPHEGEGVHAPVFSHDESNHIRKIDCGRGKASRMPAM